MLNQIRWLNSVQAATGKGTPVAATAYYNRLLLLYAKVRRFRVGVVVVVTICLDEDAVGQALQ